MKFIPKLGKFKNTIVFIHGFRKDTSSWNYDSKGKALLVEETLSQVSNTILIQLEEEDYLFPVSYVSEKIYTSLFDFLNTKITLVTHSNGSFYALKLAENYPNIFNKLFLIDPTIKTPEYLEYLKNFPEDLVECSQVVNFEDLPTGINFQPKVIVRIHFDYDEDYTSIIPYYNRLTNKNTKSRLILHYGIGHMIHWKIPHVIIDSIKELIKIKITLNLK